VQAALVLDLRLEPLVIVAVQAQHGLLAAQELVTLEAADRVVPLGVTARERPGESWRKAGCARAVAAAHTSANATTSLSVITLASRPPQG